MPPLAGYRRVSRVGDRGDRLLSPDLQAARIEAYATQHNLTVEMLPPELDVSGSRVSRPILDEAIHGVQTGRFAGVIVADLDRLSRLSLLDALKTLEQIEGAGGKVIAVAQNIDASTPEGELARNIHLSFNRMMIRRYGDQLNDAKGHAVMRGVWPLPRVPVGYECVRLRDGGDGRLHPGERADDLRTAFDQRANGASWRHIATALGVGQSAAARVIRNRVYLGELAYAGFLNPTAHEPLVSLEAWHAAQILHPAPAWQGNDPALLAGLIRCAGCGRSMTRDGSSNIYRCFPHNASGRCQAPALISTRTIDALVENVGLRLLGGTYSGQPADDTTRLHDELAAAEAELTAFQKVTSAAGDPRFFEAGLRERVQAVERARAAAARRQPLRPGLVGDLRVLWGELDVQERGQVLRSLFGVVWVRKRASRTDTLENRVRVIVAGSEPADLSRPGSGRIRPVESVEWGEGDLPGQVWPPLT